MRLPIRRYIFRCIFCIPIIWLMVILIFLLSNKLSSSPSNKLEAESNNIVQHIGGNADPRLAIDRIQSQLGEETNIGSTDKLVRAIHDNQEQVAAPDIDGGKTDLNGPGEMGKPFEVNKSRLVPSDLQKYEDGFEKNAFNSYASDLISSHRTLPDVRHPDCRKIEYKAPRVTASVVMCFHNEAWSVLLRSIHSIIDRSPPHILQEIILVDDFSDMSKRFLYLERRRIYLLFFLLQTEHLRQPLDDYVKNLNIVTIVRQKKREGLIRSRLAGAAVVESEVIIFLDSHIEVTEGWLEPLLDPISQDRTTVVTPVIDVIDDTTFKYNYGTATSISVGGFDWNLQFTWHTLPERERKRRKHELEPARSPTMAGGLFAISKRYFDEIGTCKFDLKTMKNDCMSFRRRRYGYLGW
jgi:polypeptide N-acetylgalactosaminyltransferase